MCFKSTIPGVRNSRLLFFAGICLWLPTIAEEATAQQRSRVTVVVTEQIVSVNPYADSVTMMYDLYSQTYGTLTDYNFETGTYVSRFAESWSNPDPTTWLFKLKKGLKRNNGEPVLAADFPHSISRARSDAQSKQQQALDLLATITV